MRNQSFLVLLIVVVGIMVMPIAQTAKLALVVLALLVLLYLKRGYFYVALGSRALNAKEPDEEKAWRFYEQGWKAGLPLHYTVMLGNLFVQRGDAAVALKIFDSVLVRATRKRGQNAEIAISATVSRSMALWVLNRREEAIESLMEVRKGGKMDKNLAINLGSYLLEEGRLDEARQLIDEASSQLPENPGMTDNRGHLMLLVGQLSAAHALYERFLAEGTPQFPEAYVHAAQVNIALGKYGRAGKQLHEALTKPFYQTSVVTKETVETMLAQIADLHDSSDDGEGLDEQLVATLYEEDLFDDDSPNTDVDDDDDLDPNIELDPEDYDDDDDPDIDVEMDDESVLESQLFDDEYDDDEEGSKK